MNYWVLGIMALQLGAGYNATFVSGNWKVGAMWWLYAGASFLMLLIERGTK
jgi:hypothetical protein